MPEQPKPLSILFRMVIVACGLFVITIFALVASLFSDSNSPLIDFLNLYGGTIIGCEVFAIISLSLIALKFDRSPVLRNLDEFENRYHEPVEKDQTDK
ncbi:hypothetical protein MNBD_PLANCTO02-653 [hydrothermal vent metagenome]|uniref:Uncharacterized protein n=1 Tax=hydrothermal vent metagenome TaxID=652676 RepID=A0A3B1DS42_9ZZZZ